MHPALKWNFQPHRREYFEVYGGIAYRPFALPIAQDALAFVTEKAMTNWGNTPIDWEFPGSISAACFR
jgi:hypothetical protein